MLNKYLGYLHFYSRIFPTSTGSEIRQIVKCFGLWLSFSYSRAPYCVTTFLVSYSPLLVSSLDSVFSLYFLTFVYKTFIRLFVFFTLVVFYSLCLVLLSLLFLVQVTSAWKLQEQDVVTIWSFLLHGNMTCTNLLTKIIITVYLLLLIKLAKCYF